MATKFYVATAGVLRVLSGSSPTLTAPSPPSILGVTPGDSQVTVRYGAPVSDGGSPILSYTVTVSPGSFVVSGLSPAARACTVAGLTNGTTYTATVTATNAIGTSTSPASAAVTPVASQAGTGYGGGTPGWAQIKNVTNGLPQGLSGDTRAPATLVTAESLGITIGGGSYRLATARTFDSVLFAGPILISATNGPMIFNRCAFRRTPAQASSYTGITTTSVVSTANRPQCYDCDFDGGGVWANDPNPDGTPAGHSAGGAMNCPNGFKIVRCYIHNSVHCLDNPTAGAVADQCYMDNIIQAYGNASISSVSHNDVIQWFGAGTTGAQITNCVLDNYNYNANKIGNTSVIQNGGGFTSTSTMHNILVDSCLMSHGGYTVRSTNLSTQVDVVNYVFNNNRIEPNMTYGVDSGRDVKITWTNNTYNSSGTLPGGQQVIAGQLVP